MQLRPYQEDVFARARAEIRAGRKRFICVMPTASGKTVTFCALISMAVAKGSRVLVIAHRKELVTQASEKLDRFGVPHGVVMANHPRWQPHMPVQVASRDTLVARLNKPGFNIGEFQILIPDEAHHFSCESSMKIVRRWPDAVMVGWTATPARKDNRPLGIKFDDDGKFEYELFQSLVIGPTVAELIADGHIVPYEGFTYDMPDLRNVRKSGGDYNLEMLGAAMKPTVLGGKIIHDYLDHANGLRALAFAVNVEHSMALIQQARDAGISAEHIDANTPANIRDGVAKRVATGQTMFVSSVGVYTEGTDIPAIECVIAARPTKSIVMARQMLGRGFRLWCFTCQETPGPTCAGHHVKRMMRIHDHAGMLLDEDIGLPDADIEWSLSSEWKPKQPAPVRTCKGCMAVLPSSVTVCPRCQATMEAVKGIRRVVEDHTAQRLSIDELRARRPLGTRDLSDHHLRKVHAASREEKAAEFLRLCAIRDAKGLKERFPYAAYRSVFGTWPEFDPAFLADITPASRPFIPLPPRKP